MVHHEITRQEGNDGPEIAHLNKETPHETSNILNYKQRQI
jgi:hypothetical protein